MKEQDRAALAKYRIKRARETFNEVPTQIENGFLNTAVNRLYYASYYAVVALLVKHKIVAQLLMQERDRCLAFIL